MIQHDFFIHFKMDNICADIGDIGNWELKDLITTSTLKQLFNLPSPWLGWYFIHGIIVYPERGNMHKHISKTKKICCDDIVIWTANALGSN